MIRDLFMDVVDEFGLYNREESDGDGLFYYISTASLDEDIVLWIADIKDIITMPDRIKNSKVLKDFEKRIESIGYKITHRPYSWYDITISYKDV